MGEWSLTLRGELEPSCVSVSLGVPAGRGPESATWSGAGLLGVVRGSGIGLGWRFGRGEDGSATGSCGDPLGSAGWGDWSKFSMKRLPDAPVVLWGDGEGACWDAGGASLSARVELEGERRVRESAEADGWRSLLRNADMGAGEEEGVESGKRWAMEPAGSRGETEYGVTSRRHGSWSVLERGLWARHGTAAATRKMHRVYCVENIRGIVTRLLIVAALLVSQRSARSFLGVRCVALGCLRLLGARQPGRGGIHCKNKMRRREEKRAMEICCWFDARSDMAALFRLDLSSGFSLSSPSHLVSPHPHPAQWQSSSSKYTQTKRPR